MSYATSVSAFVVTLWGDYIKGRIEHIYSIAVTVSENSREHGAIESALTEDNCRGYTDFTGAS